MKVTDPDPICDRCHKPKSGHYEVSTSLFCSNRRYDAFRRPKAAMPGLGIAPHPDVPTGSYVHRKSGGRYEVIGGVFDATDDYHDVRVLYQSPEHGYLATRTIADFLRGFRPAGPMPAPPKPPKPHPERILGIARDRLEAILGGPLASGFTPNGPDQDRAIANLDAVLAASELRVRDAVEDDPSFKQLIPYRLVAGRDGGLLVYRRGAGSEARLSGRLSIGVGGHLDEAHLPAGGRTTLADLYEASLIELREEIRFPAGARSHSTHLLGLVNDETNPVGAVHFGIVLGTEVRDDLAGTVPGEAAISDLGLASPPVLRMLSPWMETWSRLIVESGCLDPAPS